MLFMREEMDSETTCKPAVQVVVDVMSEVRLRPGGLDEEIKQSMAKMETYTKESEFQELLKELLEKLIVEQPEDPLEFLIAYLGEPCD